MNIWIIAQLLVSLAILTSAQPEPEPEPEPEREACTTAETCQPAYECESSHYWMKKAEKRQCMEGCAAASMVTDCLPAQPDMSALTTCLDTAVCSADNLANAQAKKGGSGKMGKRHSRDKRGAGHDDHHDGKHSCHSKAKFIRKLFEKEGVEVTEHMDTFLTCLEGCSSCKEEEEEVVDVEEEEDEDVDVEEEVHPCADHCSTWRLFRPAMRTCFEDPAVKAAFAAYEKPDLAATCQCFATRLGVTDTTVCDKIEKFVRHMGGKHGGGKHGGGKHGGGKHGGHHGGGKKGHHRK